MASAQHHPHGPPPFTISSLWSPAHVNPVNLKSYTLNIFDLRSPYARNFHLSWLGFHVAFLSWFAFPPLIPEAIKTDLKLTTAQIGNSNIIALLATLIVRVIVGPLVDRYGPRKVMAALLILGAIPSGLAGTVTTVNGLYAVRFFIGILGGTFVPCQAWTTAFFDKNVVGTANALVGGWGNAGGGTTFLIMVALFQRLTTTSGLSPHAAWRVAFAAVPVPALLFVAVITLLFGTDCPAGKWEDRHKAIHAPSAAQLRLNENEAITRENSEEEKPKREDFEDSEDAIVRVEGVVEGSPEDTPITSSVDTAISTALTPAIALATIMNPRTWLPALGYLTTFGFELAVDANLANVLFGLYNKRLQDFGQTKAGYIASIFGLLNIITRPFGGYLGDVLYRRYGVPGKKYLTLACGFLQGMMAIALGLYINSTPTPSLATIIGIMILFAIFNEAGNGANFSLTPHCNPNSNGFMTGIVGAMGNLGGIFFALVFRFEASHGKAFWISGIIAAVVNVALVVIPVPKR